MVGDLMEEFEVEIDDKMVKLSVRRPKIKHTKEYQNCIFKHTKTIGLQKSIQEGKPLTEEQSKDFQDTNDDITKMKNTIMIKLCPELKSIENIELMATEDYQKIWSWVEEKMGVKKDFLAKSPSP